MAARIETDLSRFRQIVRGRVREELKKHLGQQELVGRQGKRLVSIPVPHLELPHFVHDPGGKGVGQGDGTDGQGKGKQAGGEPGQHMLEAEFTVEEIAKMLGEALELPRIQPKGCEDVDARTGRYTGITPVGPESLRHFKRTYKQALKRQISMGTYNPSRPIVIRTRDDLRFRSWKTEEEPVANAVMRRSSW